MTVFHSSTALVKDAYCELIKAARTQKLPPEKSEGADPKKLKGLEGHVAESLNGRTRADSPESQASGRRDLFDIVSFMKANFIRNWKPPQDMPYDTIIWYIELCFIFIFCLLIYLYFTMDSYFSFGSLSVSKWVHLNWGDEGLISLFVTAWKLLRPVL